MAHAASTTQILLKAQTIRCATAFFSFSNTLLIVHGPIAQFTLQILLQQYAEGLLHRGFRADLAHSDRVSPIFGNSEADAYKGQRWYDLSHRIDASLYYPRDGNSPST
jgi:hypothetical protein